MTTEVDTVLHHRPFAVLLRPTADDTAITGGAVRAEIRALVDRGALNRCDGADLLARLGLQVLPYRWAVAVSVPVAVAITAPNDRYATQAGIGQLAAALGLLRAAYLTGPGAITAPADDPAHHSLKALTCRRVEACRGYPAGGVYRVGAVALLAVTVTADTETAARTAARARLTADLARVTGIRAQPARMRQLGVHRFTGLDNPLHDPGAAGQAAPATPPRRREHTR